MKITVIILLVLLVASSCLLIPDLLAYRNVIGFIEIAKTTKSELAVIREFGNYQYHMRGGIWETKGWEFSGIFSQYYVTIMIKEDVIDPREGVVYLSHRGIFTGDKPYLEFPSKSYIWKRFWE